MDAHAHVLVLWQRNTVTDRQEWIGELAFSADRLRLLSAPESQRAWLARVVDALNLQPATRSGDLSMLRVLLGHRYNLSVQVGAPGPEASARRGGVAQ